MTGRQHEGRDIVGTSCSQARDLEIPADLAMLHEARDWAAGVAEEFGLSEDECFQIKLAMSEAVTNAIIHGSDADHDSVRIVAEQSNGLLSFEVADGGRDNPARDHRRLDEGGRGLELMAMVMDEVHLTRDGNGGLLRFSKRLADAA